jgi:hypothetical protein
MILKGLAQLGKTHGNRVIGPEDDRVRGEALLG